MISIKSPSQIELMRASGDVLAQCMDEVLGHAKPGVSTAELDIVAEQFLRGRGAIPSFKNFRGGPGVIDFPGSICCSVNEEVVHGLPRKTLLKDGDLLSIDMGAILNGWHSDMARTIQIGHQTEQAVHLMEVTKASFYAGMDKAREGNRLKDISRAVEAVIEEAGMGIVRDLTGHGIGREMHEDPEVPNYSYRGPNPRLRVGMVLAIEPMVTLGTGGVAWEDRTGWPVTTEDGTLAAHYENTVAIMPDGPQILTKRLDQ